MLARCDAALGERLREITRRHHENMQRRARAYFPEVGPELARNDPANDGVDSRGDGGPGPAPRSLR